MAKPTGPSGKIKFLLQEMFNRSFDSDFNINTVEMIGYDGTNLQRIKVNADGEMVIDTSGGEQALNIQVDSGDANIEYIGKAAIASATSAAVWQVKKVNITTGTVITWADGDDSYDNIFDNREALSYS